MTYTHAPKCAGGLTAGGPPAVLRAMFERMQEPKSTLPPGPADAAAFEHAARLREIDRKRGADAGLLRDLAEGWAAAGGGRGRAA
jgi:hypothetical protein